MENERVQGIYNLRELTKRAETKGYAAGREAAAKWQEGAAAKSSGLGVRGTFHREDAKAIRALDKEGP